MSSADLTYLFINSAVKCALESVLSFGEDTRFGRGGCLRRMLGIPHIIPYGCQMTCNLPTMLSSDDLTATLRFFFDIFGALDEWIWFTVSRTGERSCNVKSEIAGLEMPLHGKGALNQTKSDRSQLWD